MLLTLWVVLALFLGPQLAHSASFERAPMSLDPSTLEKDPSTYFSPPELGNMEGKGTLCEHAKAMEALDFQPNASEFEAMSHIDTDPMPGPLLFPGVDVGEGEGSPPPTRHTPVPHPIGEIDSSLFTPSIFENNEAHRRLSTLRVYVFGENLICCCANSHYRR